MTCWSPAGASGPRSQLEASPPVVALDQPGATDARRVGGKAAALARAARAGLRTLPGVVLTTALADTLADGADVAAHPAVRAAYDRAGGDGTPLVVRSSSLAEDTAGSSMAGQFESVVDVRGWDAFVAAVGTVLDSRHRAGAGDHPIAVLVQPFLDAAVGGVLFGVDPVTGRSDRRVVTAVEGGPAPLVSGEVDGSRYVLDDDGAVVERVVGDGPELARDRLGELVALSGEVARAFGGPQDVEWAIDGDGVLWVLQSRPVTTDVRGVPDGPVFGPGPVAETFPEPLSELERDLWVPPLRTALREAIVLAGAASRQRADASEAVVDIGGRVAVDLGLIGERPPRPRVWQRLNPLPAAGRLRGAWRVGRLRAALPELAGTLVERVDADLQAVPDLNDLTSRQLLGVLHRSASALRTLHAHEILMGLLIDTGEDMTTGASVALRVLVQGREAGLRDADIVRRSPVVLALAPPRVAPAAELPPQVSAGTLLPGRAAAAAQGAGSGSPAVHAEQPDTSAVLREALRLRVRWLHELSGRAAWELGRRLAASGTLPEPERIRHLRLDDLVAVVTDQASVVRAVLEAHVHEDGEPLPARFRVSDLGRAVPAGDGGGGGDGGTGAGGGVASGPVTHDTEDPAPGSVLVTTTLTPALGPLLPRLAGLVTETGSVLSHLAILARESDVATVVGLAGATRELPEGAVVEVDGTSGRVTVQTVEEEVAS